VPIQIPELGAVWRVNWLRYIIKLHGKHGIGLAKSRRKECHPLTPFFTLAVRRPVIEFWDVQPLVRILGFGRRYYVLESSCNYLRYSQEISNVQEICGLRKDDFSRRARQRMRFALCCSTAHNTIRQRSVFPCRLQFPPSRETRSTLEQSMHVGA
jgi:hypothetical protein